MNAELNMYVYLGIESVVVGALAAVTILYGFQTRVPYPDFVLRTLNHPWILVIVGVIAIITFRWSPPIAVLLLILLAAFCVDTMAFARPLPQLLNQTPAERLSRQSVGDAVPAVPFAVRVPGVGVTVTDAGVALSSVPLPVPQYPIFASSIFASSTPSGRFADAAFTAPTKI